MKKILAFLAAILLLCCACEPSNEKEYIAQLEERIAKLEQQLSAAQESVGEKQAAPSLPSLEAEKESAQPQSTQSADTKGAQVSASLIPQDSGDGTVTVYITKTGKKYHKEGCGSLSKSSIPISLNEAIAKGYTPCGKCKPP